ncbi:MAG: MFS transporter [Solirubrobacteraceae bacterium]|nr:MFS transporter [Solirubrobacteraceae bacterium]
MTRQLNPIDEPGDAAPPRHVSLSEAERDALAARTIRVVFAAQIFSGAGLAAGITVGALLAEEMIGRSGVGGLPTALFTIGSAAAALLVGRLTQRSGRRPGLAAGYAVGAIGGAGVVAAATIDSVGLLLVSLLLYGSGVATNLQARYAGADLVAPARRGRAVSTVLVATTLGGVIGPNTVEFTGGLATDLGTPALAGPFMLATVAYTVAALVVAVLLRPDPLLTARRLAAVDAPAAPVGKPDGTSGLARSAVSAASTPGARTGPAQAAESDAARRSLLMLGAAAMIITQVVMVAVMTMTPIHMRDHGHSLSDTGLVISIHIAAMFLPSPITGRLVDQVGRKPVIAAGGATLAAAGLLAAAAPADSMVLLTFALALLGLGWNLGLVGGTALVTDATPLAQRARTQGNVDLGVALSGAAGGLGSGFIVAGTSYALLSLLGGALALAILPFLVAGPRPER